MSSDDPMLEVDHVSVTLSGLKILDDVSLHVLPGTVTGLIGPNGAGKTTVFNVVSGFLKPDKGKVRVDGRSIGHSTHHLTKHGVARTLQGVGLFPSLTALQNVMLGASASVKSGVVAQSLAMPWTDIENKRTREAAMQALESLGVADIAGRLPSELPYPLQKKVALARALVSDPRLIMLDEPAGGVSAGDVAELAQLIRSWTPQRTVLLVEHHMELVMDVCDEVWVLDAGKVIAFGSPDEIRNDPAVLQAYLGEDGAA